MPIPQLQPVQSSNIAAVGYDATESTLYVKFRDGSIYAYSDVPANEYEALRSAPSVGAYLNTNIKGTYSASRI